jgi:hypothetical protein
MLGFPDDRHRRIAEFWPGVKAISAKNAGKSPAGKPGLIQRRAPAPTWSRPPPVRPDLRHMPSSLLNGIVGDRSGPTLAIQTPTEWIVVERAEVEAVRPSERSLRSEGLMDALSTEQVRNLIADRMPPRQVPGPREARPRR